MAKLCAVFNQVKSILIRINSPEFYNSQKRSQLEKENFNNLIFFKPDPTFFISFQSLQIHFFFFFYSLDSIPTKKIVVLNFTS